MKFFYLAVLIFGSIRSIWSQTDGILPVDDGRSGQCQNHTVDMCNGIGPSIYLPNFRNHATQLDASAELHDFRQLIESGCSEFVRQFFCSFYFPLCYVSSGTNQAVRLSPCRALCIETRQKCEPVLLQNSNFTWPVFLNCSLDTFVSDGVCFGQQITQQPSTATPTGVVVQTTQPIVATVNDSLVTMATTGRPPSVSTVSSAISPTTSLKVVLFLFCFAAISL